MDLQGAMSKLEHELNELEGSLADPAVVGDGNRYRDLARRHSDLLPQVTLIRELRQAESDLAEARTMLEESAEEEMREFLEQEIAGLEERLPGLEQQVMLALVPPDPMAEKPAILEIRAGTGGEEAALFARDLFDMYTRYAERRHWKVEVLDESESERDGYKEVVFAVKGRGAYGALQLESGVHRVQRVPSTETQGRIHTSAATVAVLPEVEDVDVHIEPSELTLEAFRAGGPGGQHMQKNETAVRLTHVPSGISVTCSSERSQQQNRERALAILRARLYEVRRREQEMERAAQRREQIGSGDRSEKIRTYNFPQDRITDHRVGLTVHHLPSLLAGEIDELITALEAYEKTQRLAEVMEETP